MTLGGVLLAVHLLAAIVWVGGMFFALVVLRPGMAFLEGALRLELHEQVFRRFFRIVWYAMPILGATGLSMIHLLHGGPTPLPWHVRLMTGTGLAMSLIFLGIVAGPWARMRAAMAGRDLRRAGGAVQWIRRLVTINLVLGLLTAMVAALGG
ncbi:conserved membrane protein of unknown function [Rhodovastum atsumiense]|uniref:Copper resistance protein D domain-containing protein n=1 Tax=Rhodovastum atsumiense TaxID=504468 RepID=A0A5M6J1B1_9PROT|nr:CopD family protein [Rhodovastum atsumiense]KAA5614392.1 hypothetical protein F1189_02060 [Rhodovastum atsumiense]CAH2604869.1 conserved membrane protein of unknown function [Rhodovastum atsumiense]